jgi:hypothetical protein
MSNPEFNSRPDEEFTTKREITFVDNPGKQCVQACTAMLLKEYFPQVDFAWHEIETLTGYKEGLSTWGTQHLLGLNDLGIETAWIENVDLDRFSLAPFEYMRTLFSDEVAYRFQVEHSDLPLEARRVQEYLDRGLVFEEREATADDIKDYLQAGWLVRLEVNGKPLADQSGYGAHSVLVSGYNNETVILQNPDSAFGQKPNQCVSWELLEKAWQEFGDSKSLNAYRRHQ